MQVTFELEKATKNTIKFTEVLESEMSAAKVGTIYIPKATLGTLGWSEGKQLTVDLQVR